MPECQCGAWVSIDFARVFADREGDVRGYISCIGTSGVDEVFR